MAAKDQRSSRRTESAIDAIRVQGFKSHRGRTEITIRPLTLLAGQNSAGKSSVIQPLLIAKQTLEATWDPGALALDGPCFRGATADGLLWRGRRKEDHLNRWSLGVCTGGSWVTTTYVKGRRGGFEVERTEANLGGKDVVLVDGDLPSAVREAVSETLDGTEMTVVSNRISHVIQRVLGPVRMFVKVFPTDLIESIIHLPGLRGNPERTYQVTRTGGNYPGSFSPYAASALLAMQDGEPDLAEGVSDDLRTLGVTWKAKAQRVRNSDTQVEVKVGRLPQPQAGGALDLVNIADVGFGASQVLPVVVALRAARPGQLVHIEQPELHLHPNAQVQMAKLLVQAALRGARVVVETHSSVLVKAVQLAVAGGQIDPKDVALHWFSRDNDGATHVRHGDLDRSGAYGDWPVDFAEVEMNIEAAFIEASFAAETSA
jgi:hypothetical protein